MADQDQAARLLFLSIDAAHHLDRPADVAALARRIGTLDCAPGYHRLAGWLLKAVAGEQVPDPWQVLDAVPDTLTEHHGHRWLVSMAISRRGPFPEAAREFGLVAADRLRGSADGTTPRRTPRKPSSRPPRPGSGRPRWTPTPAWPGMRR